MLRASAIRLGGSDAPLFPTISAVLVQGPPLIHAAASVSESRKGSSGAAIKKRKVS
jgi:hypothetical protein